MATEEQEFEKLYNVDDKGGYCLIFPNKFSLTKDEIISIFSEFGPILSTSESGDNCGMRFVRYTNIEDTMKAIRGLQNHRKVKLIPHKLKLGTHFNGYRNRANNDSNQMKKVPQESQNLNFNPKRNVSQEPLLNLDNNVNGNQNASYEGSRGNIKNMNNFNKNSEPKCSPPPLVEKRYQQQYHKQGTSPKSLSSNNEQKLNGGEELPELIKKSNKASSTSLINKKITVNAEEVIVANFNLKYGPAYFLHLFQDYDPIAVSYVQKLPKINNGYCHVYFKNELDANAVQKLFDKIILDNQKITVLRPCNLIEEAKLCI